MLNIIMRAAGPYQVNTMIVWCDRTHDAAIIDPAGGSEETFSEVSRLKLKPVALLNTHGHLDHITENHLIKDRYHIPLLIHPLDRPMLTDPQKNLSAFSGDPVVSPDADGELSEDQPVTIGEDQLKVLHVPGHTAGSVVFYHQGFLIAGDTLFAGSIGRADFPGSDEHTLIANIRSKLYTLPPMTMVYPGHGPTTTIGEERLTNPFVRA